MAGKFGGSWLGVRRARTRLGGLCRNQGRMGSLVSHFPGSWEDTHPMTGRKLEGGRQFDCLCSKAGEAAEGCRPSLNRDPHPELAFPHRLSRAVTAPATESRSPVPTRPTEPSSLPAWPVPTAALLPSLQPLARLPGRQWGAPGPLELGGGGGAGGLPPTPRLPPSSERPCMPPGPAQRRGRPGRLGKAAPGPLCGARVADVPGWSPRCGPSGGRGAAAGTSGSVRAERARAGLWGRD